MAETRATMRARVQALVGTAIDTTINQGLKDGCKKIQDFYNWSCMEASTTVTVASGDSTFELPSDFKAEMNPEMSTSDLISYRRMKKILKNQIESRDTYTSRPLAYRIWNQGGYLYETADDDYTFSLEYYKYFDDFDDDDAPSDTDFQNFLNDMHELIEDYATARAFRRLRNLDAALFYQNDDIRRGPYGQFERKLFAMQKKEEDIKLANVSLIMEEPG